MKVVVTGGAGFIGSHLVDALLEKGCDVTVIDDLSSGREGNLEKAFAKKSPKVELIKGNISDAKIWEKLPAHDALFHLAAQTSVTASVENPDHDFDSNVNSFRHIVKWIRKNKVRVLVYTNTAGAMYGAASTFPTDERHAMAPLCPYGATKTFPELYIGSLARALKASGDWSSLPSDANYFSWASLRLGNVYGPRQITKGEAGVIPIFIETIAQGKTPTIFGDGRKTRDYVYVRDVVRAYVAAWEKLQQVALDDFYNVGTMVETHDIDVFDGVLDAMQARSKTPGAPAATKNAQKINEPIFKPVRPGEVLRSFLNTNKIEAFLGWRPETDFQSGVNETVNTYPL
jgi:UDP-glucose 4-epimerase